MISFSKADPVIDGLVIASPVEVVKNVWQEEVEQRPQLCQVVLEGGSRQQETIGSII